MPVASKLFVPENVNKAHCYIFQMKCQHCDSEMFCTNYILFLLNCAKRWCNDFDHSSCRSLAAFYEIDKNF